MREIAQVICVALSDRFEAEREALRERTRALMERYPLYPQLAARSRTAALTSRGLRRVLLRHQAPAADALGDGPRIEWCASAMADARCRELTAQRRTWTCAGLVQGRRRVQRVGGNKARKLEWLLAAAGAAQAYRPDRRCTRMNHGLRRRVRGGWDVNVLIAGRARQHRRLEQVNLSAGVVDRRR